MYVSVNLHVILPWIVDPSLEYLFGRRRERQQNIAWSRMPISLIYFWIIIWLGPFHGHPRFHSFVQMEGWKKNREKKMLTLANVPERLRQEGGRITVLSMLCKKVKQHSLFVVDLQVLLLNSDSVGQVLRFGEKATKTIWTAVTGWCLDPFFPLVRGAQWRRPSTAPSRSNLWPQGSKQPLELRCKI